MQDLNVLTDVSREIAATYAHEDPLELGKQWGMIQNSHVKVCGFSSCVLSVANRPQRRTGPPTALPPQPAAPKSTVPAKRKEQPTPVKEESKKGEEPSSKPPSQPKDTPQPEDTPAPTKPAERTAPKKEKNSIFSSFAKAKPKQKKEASETPASNAESVSLPSHDRLRCEQVTDTGDRLDLVEPMMVSIASK